MTRVYINGKLFDKADAKVSVYDHGLLYGDGIFEGLRIYSGKVFRLREHLERLYESRATSIWKSRSTASNWPTRWSARCWPTSRRTVTSGS